MEKSFCTIPFIVAGVHFVNASPKLRCRNGGIMASSKIMLGTLMHVLKRVKEPSG